MRLGALSTSRRTEQVGTLFRRYLAVHRNWQGTERDDPHASY